MPRTKHARLTPRQVSKYKTGKTEVNRLPFFVWIAGQSLDPD